MPAAIQEIDGRQLDDAQGFRSTVLEPCRPLVLRGLVARWPAVQRARESVHSLGAYLASFGPGQEMELFVGAPQIAGKYFYRDDLDGFNFERRRARFADAVGRMIDSAGVSGAPSLYAGSLALDSHLPGFQQQNALTGVLPGVEGRIWVGHASNVSSHYDAFENVACVVAGRRRFTLYPPEAIGHLYVGPIDHTMAGQPVSLAASGAKGEYPLFESIRDSALVAELEPGDALFLPKLWWHQVEATAPFNVLVNYWWDAFSSGPDAPYTAMLLAMIAIAERPPAERQAWRAFFDHYVFRSNGHPLAHLPDERHGILGPLKPHNYGRIRAHVMQMLRGR